MRNWMLMIVAALTLGGCASNGGAGGGDAEATGEKKTEMVCRRVKKVGSNFSETVCKSRQQIERERRAAEDSLSLERQRQQRSNIVNSRNTGG